MKGRESVEGAGQIRQGGDTLVAAQGIAPSLVQVTIPSGAARYPANETSSSSAPTRPTIELQFDDPDTPIIVDAELNFDDPRLVQLRQWWAAAAHGMSSIPLWRDEHLDQIAFVREHVHLHEIDPTVGNVRIRFMGAAILRALGEDLTGQRFDLSERAGSAPLAGTLARAFETVNLTRQVRAPLRTYAKTFHRLPMGCFTGEGLWLPFCDGGHELILGATILRPFDTSAVSPGGYDKQQIGS